MANQRARRNRASIYQMKRLYGGTLTLVKQGAETTDLLTGVKTSTSSTLTINKAVIIPAKTKRSQTQGASQVDSGKEFMYGAYYDRTHWNFLIDPKDLPAGYEIENDDWVEYNGDRFDVHLVNPAKFGSPWSIQAVRADVSDSPVTTTPQYFLYADSTISLSDSHVLNRVQNLTVTSTDVIDLQSASRRLLADRLTTSEILLSQEGLVQKVGVHPLQASDAFTLAHAVDQSKLVTVIQTDGITLTGTVADHKESQPTDGDTIAITDSASATAVFGRSGVGTLALNQFADSDKLSNLTASATSTLAMSGSANFVALRDGVNTLVITQSGDAQHVAVRTSEATLAVSQSAQVAKVMSITGTDTLVVSASADVSKVAVVTTSDSITLSASGDAEAHFPRSASNLDTLTQSVTVNKVAVVTADGTITLTDAAARMYVASTTAADTLALSGSGDAEALFGRSASHLDTLSQTADAAKVAARTSENTLTVDDAASVAAVRSLTASESLTLTASGDADKIVPASGFNTLSFTVTADVSRVQHVTASESLSLSQTSDIAMAYARSDEQALALAQAAEVAKVAALTGSTDVLVTQEAERNHDRVLAASDSVSLTQAAEASRVRSTTASDTITLSQSADRTHCHYRYAQYLTLSLGQTATLDVEYARSDSQTLSLTQAADVAVVSATDNSATDNLSLTDTLLGEFEFARSDSQALSLTQSASGTLASSSTYVTSGMVSHWNINATGGYPTWTGSEWSFADIAAANTSALLTTNTSSVEADVIGTDALTGAKYMMFDGVNDHFYAGTNDAELRRNTTQSYECWVRLKPGTNDASFYMLMFGGAASTDTGRKLTMSYNNNASNGEKEVWYTGNGWASNQVRPTGGTPGLNSHWVHTVITDDDTTLKLYVDGVEVQSVSKSVSPNCSAGGGFRMLGGLSGWDYFPGDFAAARVYDRALTAAEVQQNYDVDKDIYTAPLRQHASMWLDYRSWRSGDTEVYDQTDNANDAIIQGTGSGVDVTESTFALNGTDDYVYVPETDQWNTQFDGSGTDYTMEIWGKQTDIESGLWDLGYMDWFDTSPNPRTGTTVGLAGGNYGNGGVIRAIYGNSDQFGQDFGPGQDATYGNATDGTVIVDDHFHHLVLTADRDGTLTLYVDGVSQATASAGTAASQASNARQLYMGRRAASSTYRTGANGNARLYYGKALTGAEVLRNYKSEKELYKRAIPVAEYDMTNTSSYTDGASTINDLAFQNGTDLTDLTIEGTPRFTSNNSGELTFNGSTDAAVGTTTEMDFSDGTLSVDAWVRIMDDAHAGYGTIIGKTNYGDSAREWILQHRSTDKLVYLWVYNGTAWSSVSTSQQIFYGQWYNITATLDGNGNGEIFVNGLTDNTSTSMATTIPTSDAEVAIGALRSGASALSDECHIELQYAAVYNGVLTSGEILDAYTVRRPNYEPVLTNCLTWLDASRYESYSAPTSDWYDISNQRDDYTSANSINYANQGSPVLTVSTDNDGGQFWRCDGVSDGFSASTVQTGDYTYALWIRRHDYDATHLFEGNALSSPSLEGGDTLTCYHNNSENVTAGAEADQANEWNLYTVTWDNTTQTLTYYLNGGKVGEDTTTGTSWTAINLYLMYRGNGNSRFTDGDIAAFRWYDSPLSASDILSNYTKEKVRYGHTTVKSDDFALQLDGQTAPVSSTWADSSSNSNDATLNGTTIHSSAGGGFYTFDDQYPSYGQITQHASMEPTKEFILNMWVRWTFESGLRVFTSNSHGNSNSDGWGIEQPGTSALQALVSLDNAFKVLTLGSTASSDLGDNTWRMLTVVFSITEDTYKVYADGILKNTFGSSISAGTAITYQNLDTYIAQWGYGSRYLTSDMGQVEISDKFITTPDVMAKYQVEKSRFGL